MSEQRCEICKQLCRADAHEDCWDGAKDYASRVLRKMRPIAQIDGWYRLTSVDNHTYQRFETREAAEAVREAWIEKHTQAADNE